MTAEQVKVVLTANRAKVAVCEALITINAEDPRYPFIPPTAIDWIGDAIVRALVEACGEATT